MWDTETYVRGLTRTVVRIKTGRSRDAGGLNRIIGMCEGPRQEGRGGVNSRVEARPSLSYYWTTVKYETLLHTPDHFGIEKGCQYVIDQLSAG